MATTVQIDGSIGGGQILRSSLSLSALTGQPFVIDPIRGQRKRAGLMRQHLTAVRAAAQICGAQVVGDELGSTRLTFSPGALVPHLEVVKKFLPISVAVEQEARSVLIRVKAT